MSAVVAESVQNPFQSAPVAAVPQTASATALVQREVAEVQAAMMIARKFPRDPIAAMDRILQACTRPALARTALYQFSRGGSDISGPSIRLAEEIARQWGNIRCGIAELSRANGVSECLAYAVDNETGFSDEKRFQVKHWRDTKNGGYQLKDERDIYELIANQGSRRKRACLLAVIPADVQESAVEQVELTLRTKTDVTPERVKAMVEKFAEFGVTQQQIEKRIQRRIDAMTPALMVQLGRTYNSLKDGMSVAADWFEPTQQDAPADASQAPSSVAGNEGAKARLRGRHKPDQAPATPASELFDAEASRALDREAERNA